MIIDHFCILHLIKILRVITFMIKLINLKYAIQEILIVMGNQSKLKKFLIAIYFTGNKN
jgi:hypothetical protein